MSDLCRVRMSSDASSVPLHRQETTACLDEVADALYVPRTRR